MPTKTKELNDKNKKKVTPSKSAKNVVKKVSKEVINSKVDSSSKKQNNTEKKSVTKKANKIASKKSTISKKVANQKNALKTSTKKTTKKVKPLAEVVEYYDLPYRYNETIVKILYQTPDTLFVYWDIADSDRENYIKQYGENFFNITRPVLIVHNDTMNYSFEIPINDFANSWYLHVNDSKSDYRIELGRRPFQVNENIKTDYIYVSSSNEIESPNDHILFNNSQKMVYYRNIKTNVETAKPFTSLSFIKNMGKIYEIYDLYQELYKNEENIEDLTNPSSHTSSQFK